MFETISSSKIKATEDNRCRKCAKGLVLLFKLRPRLIFILLKHKLLPSALILVMVLHIISGGYHMMEHHPSKSFMH